jgi:hypothetical protein
MWEDKVVSKSKQKGTAAETAVVRWLSERTKNRIERRTLSGSNDKGDIAGMDGVVIEVKNHARMELAQWVAELETEIANDNADTGVVIHKKRGTTDVGEWYATMPVRVWFELVKSRGRRK